MDFMKYDSPFMKALQKITSYVFLGLLWVVASIPVLTFGAATTAAFFTAEKSIHNGEERMFVTFWKSFCNEFKQATLLWLLELVLVAVLGLNICFLWQIELNEIIFVLVAAATLTVLGWMQLWFTYLSKFQDTTWMLLRNTLQIAIGNIPRVLLLIALAAAAIAGFVVALTYVSSLVLFVPGMYVMLASCVVRVTFNAYLPSEAPDELHV